LPAEGVGLEPIDVAAWGASLVSTEVVRKGVLPDADLFFGFEDFDFFFALRRAGFELLVDRASARAVADSQMTAPGRDAQLCSKPLSPGSSTAPAAGLAATRGLCARSGSGRALSPPGMLSPTRVTRGPPN
jgi:hypothetical protein